MTIAAMKPATWAYSENFVAEDDVLADCPCPRGRLPGGPRSGRRRRCAAIPGRGHRDARDVVEIGTGCGVSGTWLLRGMRRDGVLTSVDVEAEHQRFARQTFTAGRLRDPADPPDHRSALDVLSRLTDGHYDLVFCDGDKSEYAEYLPMAARLLRLGGVVAIDNALWHDKVADPSVRDAETTAIREVGRRSLEAEDWAGVMLPVGDGLLCARRLSTPAGTVGQRSTGRGVTWPLPITVTPPSDTVNPAAARPAGRRRRSPPSGTRHSCRGSALRHDRSAPDHRAVEDHRARRRAHRGRRARSER